MNKDKAPIGPQKKASVEKNAGVDAAYSQGPQSTSWMEKLIDASIDSMVTLDKNFRILVWNQTTADWSGLPAQEVLHRSIFEVFPDALRTPGFKEGLEQALQGHKVFLPAGPGFYLSGHYECHLVPLKDEQEEIRGILQITHDVAHRVKKEEELRSLNRKLASSNARLRHFNEELATFAKIASHDLKEPLRRIYTFAELITMHEAPRLSNNGKANFRRIQKSLHRMALLTDDIANFSEMSVLSEALQPVDLREQLQKMLDAFASEMKSCSATVRVGEMPVIQAYPKAMQQLIRHIFSNALKFRKADVAPVIDIDYTHVNGAAIAHPEAFPDASYHCLSFKDNGIGMEPEFHKRIFQMFEKLEAASPSKGSGMGLALAQKAAQLHEGFILVESRKGEGSIFRCYLVDQLPENSDPS